MSAGAATRPASEADYAGDAFERLPPHDLLAEQITLGGMMLSTAALGDVLSVLDSSSQFYRPGHQLVFEAITGLYSDGAPTDVAAVAAELGRRGNIGRMGGAPYLHTLLASVPVSANAGYHARTVREKSILRRLVEVGGRIVDHAYSGIGDADEHAMEAAAATEDILAGQVTSGLLPIGELLPEVLEEMHSPPKTGGRVPFPYSDLNYLTGGGMLPGQVIIIAARPAVGKSVGALDCARWAAIDRPRFPAIDVLFFTLEMGRKEVLRRLVAAEARVPLGAIKAGRLTDEQTDAIAGAHERVSTAKLWLDDDPGCSLAHMRSRFLELARADRKPGLIVIDYAQLVDNSGRQFRDRQQEVSDLSRRTKLLAKKLGVPIVLLAQLNRGPEQRADKRPQLSDLRESGSLEQDADIVILLHREDSYVVESPRAGETDWIVAKHRDGPTATITVAHQFHYSRFADMAPLDDPEPDPAPEPEYQASYPGARDS